MKGSRFGRGVTSSRVALEGILEGVSGGTLSLLRDDGSRTTVGSGEPHAVVRWSDLAEQALFAQGTLGLGDAYVDGLWDVVEGDLVDVLRMGSAARVHAAAKRGTQRRRRLQIAVAALAARATRARQHRSVRAHYDVGNDFFALFLDPTMTYTCGVAASRDDDLETMQRRKLALVCDKLRLGPGCSLLDLGCGWGSLALYAAGERGAEVTAVNVSAPQLAHLARAVSERGLDSRVHLREADFRASTGVFDRVAAVGLAEHVGRRGLAGLFSIVKTRLAADGLGLVHTIGSADQGGVDPWIERRIFPGAYIATLSELARAAERAGLRVEHVENLGPHYALTLRHWLTRFRARRADVVRARGEPFARAWELYFALLIPAFEGLSTSLFQIVVAPGPGPSRLIHHAVLPAVPTPWDGAPSVGHRAPARP